MHKWVIFRFQIAIFIEKMLIKDSEHTRFFEKALKHSEVFFSTREGEGEGDGE